jgi:hypothetical protein
MLLPCINDVVWITHYGGKFKDSEFELDSEFEGFDVRALYRGI